MKRYGYEELVDTFRALDSVAGTARTIVVIGGAAVALHTKTATGTKDIDLVNADAKAIRQRLSNLGVTSDVDTLQSVDDLIQRCNERQHELVPISTTTVADFPYNYEARLEQALPQLRQLRVLIPERHDLALSKVMRWYEGDEDDVHELHAARALSVDLLVQRYVTEMDHVIGNPARIDGQFVACIDSVFGEIAADEARAALRTARS